MLGFSLSIKKVLPIALFFMLVGMLYSPGSASAYSNDLLVDDNVFMNSRSMSPSQIQSFLSQKGSALAGMQVVESISGRDLSYYPNYNKTVSVAQAIYDAARVYGMNPQVILATLQKEQSLITDSTPSSSQINFAMGYGCPDSGGCSYPGLFNQIDNGTWQLRFNRERAIGNQSWWNSSINYACSTPKPYKYYYDTNGLFPGRYVTFRDDANAPTAKGNVYTGFVIGTASTASLYCYTPHAYNNPTGAYGKPKMGTTGMYYSGSYNFVRSFEDWFGSTLSIPKNCDSKVAGVTCVWSLQKTDGSRLLTTSEVERDNAMANFGWRYDDIAFYASPTQQAGTIPIYRLRQDNSYLYTGNQSEYNTKKASGTWTDEGIAFYAYPSTASINATHTVYRLYKSSGNLHYLTTDAAEKQYMIDSGYVLESSTFNSFSGYIKLALPSAGRNNIYRLALNGGYFYTTNLNELEILNRVGYPYDGMLTTAPSTNTGTPVYRLQRNNKYLYTASTSERDSAISRYGYVSEGIGFYVDTSSAEIYRLTNQFTDGYLYTSSINEVMSASNKNGWMFQGSLVGKTSATSPIYRFLNIFNSRHFYTININEATRISNKGWQYETVAFHANTSSGQPIYRLLLRDKHFYTSNINEKNLAVSKFGYMYEGVAFYVSPSATTKPAYRLQGGNDEYFYTASAAEKDRAVSVFGYRYEGIGFYLP